MINLLPLEYRSNWRKLLRWRLINIGGLFIWGWVIFVAVISFGLLYTVKQDRLALEAQLKREGSKVASVEYQRLIQYWRGVKADAQVINSLKSLAPSFVVMDLVTRQPVAGINIESLELNNESTTTTIKVTGTGVTRANYLALVDWLKKQSGITAVTAPVSNLIKDRDLVFTLDLQL